MTPFFVSLPRTRSSILFETMRPYVEKQLGTELHMHTEMFLHWGRTYQCVNAGTGETNNTEIMPFQTKSGIAMRFVYPPVFDDNYSRNMYKLDMLKREREIGREYFIKGTATMFDGYSEIFDFYKDRLFVFTNRKNKIDMLVSLMVAWETKVFHARPKNVEGYKEKLKSITLSDEALSIGDKFIIGLQRFEQMRHYIISNNFKYIDLDYDDLETVDQRANVIDSLLNTTKWRAYVPPEEKLPLLVNKNYSSIITNMDQVYERFGSI